MVRNIKLTMEYTGTNYAGFQKQPKVPTVQGELEKALKIILKRKVKTIGAARTDAGVHAFYQVVNFKTKSMILLSRLKSSLNGLLPKDIVISKVEEKDSSFQARYSAAAKEYKYYILNRPFPSPFFGGFSYHLRPPLKLKLMQEAAEHFKGAHNFSAFATLEEQKNPLRTVLEIDLKKVNQPVTGLILIRIKADSFLHKMVRMMVGTLIEIGLGKIPPEEVKRIFKEKDKKAVRLGRTAPAQGLFLSHITYPPSQEVPSFTQKSLDNFGKILYI